MTILIRELKLGEQVAAAAAAAATRRRPARQSLTCGGLDSLQHVSSLHCAHKGSPQRVSNTTGHNATAI